MEAAEPHIRKLKTDIQVSAEDKAGWNLPDMRQNLHSSGMTSVRLLWRTSA